MQAQMDGAMGGQPGGQGRGQRGGFGGQMGQMGQSIQGTVTAATASKLTIKTDAGDSYEVTIADTTLFPAKSFGPGATARAAACGTKS